MITIIEKNDLTNQISYDENKLARNELKYKQVGPIPTPMPE